MNVAITIWDKRVSPVFDSSQTLLIAGVDGCNVTKRHIEPFDSGDPFRLVDRLKGLKVGVLICGAIAAHPADEIESRGIQLIPFVCGNADEVLYSFARNRCVDSVFLLPGCGGKQIRQRLGKADFGKHGYGGNGSGRRSRKQRPGNGGGSRQQGTGMSGFRKGNRGRQDGDTA